MSPIIGLQQRIAVVVRGGVWLERIGTDVIEPSWFDADPRAAWGLFAVAFHRRRPRGSRTLARCGGGLDRFVGRQRGASA